MATRVQLERQRRPIRKAFTQLVTEIKQLLTVEQKDLRSIRIKFTHLGTQLEELKTIDDGILGHMLGDETAEEEYEKEKEAITQFRFQYTELNDDVQSAFAPTIPVSAELTPSSAVSVAGDNGDGMRKSYKLPKIVPKTFNGEIKEWLSFWAQFRKIHKDDSLHAVDKFHYLLQAMEKGTVAHDILNPFPITEENYPKAIAALRERFGNTHVLCFYYIKELIRLIVQCSQSVMTISQIYDQVNTQLQSLQSLNIKEADMNLFLYPMVISCLPEETIVAFQRHPNATVKENEKFKALMDFLRQEVVMDQERGLARDGILKSTSPKDTNKDTPKENTKKSNPDTFQKGNPRKRKWGRESHDSEPATTSGLHVSKDTRGCIFCDKSHYSQDCGSARKLSLRDKEDKIKEKKACSFCLRTNHGGRCPVFVRCHICGKRHQTIMCPDLPGNQTSSSARHKEDKPGNSSENEKGKEKSLGSSSVNLSCHNQVLLKTVVVRVHGNGKILRARLFFDDGSQGSYIKESTVQALGLKPIGEERMSVSVFGGQCLGSKKYNKYEVELESLDRKNRMTLPVLAEEKMCGILPFVPSGPWIQELKTKQISLTEHMAERPEIEILVGSDFWGKMMTGKLEKLSSGLMAMESIFGWTLSGSVPNHAMHIMHSSTTCINFAVNDLWELEILNIRDPIETSSKRDRDQAVFNHFTSTLKRSLEGRYIVSLPWIKSIVTFSGDRERIPSNYQGAERRLRRMSENLKKSGQFAAYDQVFRQWENESLIQIVSDDKKAYYLPHRAVFKPSSKTTPVRPVFDASYSEGKALSLNQYLESGPNLIELIPTVLLRFREKAYGIIADIRKAFQMILMDEPDRAFLRFLWWEDETMSKIKVYEHTRVVFGLNCSPFLLHGVIHHHLSQVKENPEVAQQLLKSLYVDNCATSCHCLTEAQEFKQKSVNIFASAKMDLRDWEVSHEPQTEAVSVLGLLWEKESDLLRLGFQVPQLNSKLTKRDILSCVNRIFDTVGVACPTTIIPKIQLQKLWELKLGWNQDIPGSVKKEFLQWADQLNTLPKIAIPRQIITSLDKEGVQFHCFVDASQSAYAAVLFVRNLSGNAVTLRLAEARARVAPLRKPTIPRLELMACTIGARLSQAVMRSLERSGSPIQYWSDSSTALAWIKRQNNWAPFVSNRVKEILTLSKQEEWRHVPGVLNPADLPSRGCSPQQLLESKWWEGPSWLLQPPCEWPLDQTRGDESLIQQEMRKTIVTHVAVTTPSYTTKFSSYRSNIRVLGWMKRFTFNTRALPWERRREEILSIQEIKDAEISFFRMIQKDSFLENKPVDGIQTAKLDDGLRHVQTKLISGDGDQYFKWPILLPNRHPHVDMLIRDIHHSFGHIGIQSSLNQLRESFWILGGRRAVTRVIHQCIICRRQEAKSFQVDTASLPKGRMEMGSAFQTTGVDLAGPLFLRDGTKAWIVLYTCAVYRGVYLDSVTSLSTEAFLDSLESFLLTCGRPNTIYSDNGTNFVGAANLFQEIDWEAVEKGSQVRKIKWIFNPPTAAWWGGWWERLIRSVKGLLKRMLGRARLTLEQLRRSLISAQAAMNSRPLTTVTEDPNDLTPLTPNMFIRGSVISTFPEAHEMTGKKFQKEYGRMVKLRESLVQRFKKEYLGILIQKERERKSRPIQTGDIVLIGNDSTKRVDWLLGRVIELYPGKDGIIRVVKVKTATGFLIRPVQRLFPLEVSHEGGEAIEKVGELLKKIKTPKEKNVKHPSPAVTPTPAIPVKTVKTRSGRQSKKVDRLGF